MNRIIEFFSNTKNLIILFLLLLLGCIGTCNVNSYRENLDNKKAIDSLTLASQTKDSIINKNGEVINKQITIITEDQKSLRKLHEDNFNLTRKYEKRIKDIISFYQEKTTTRIDSVYIPYKDTSDRKQWEDSLIKSCSTIIDYYETNYVKTPKVAEDSTENYNIKLTVTKDSGVLVNSLIIPDTESVEFVTIKGGLFKRGGNGKVKFWAKKRVEVLVKHTNSLIKVNGMNSALYNPPKGSRFWNTVKDILFVSGGFVLGKKF